MITAQNIEGKVDNANRLMDLVTASDKSAENILKWDNTLPNLWGEIKTDLEGNHRFLILDGCKDLSEGKSKGFFNEMLKPELRQIRKILEAYTSLV